MPYIIIQETDIGTNRYIFISDPILYYYNNNATIVSDFIKKWSCDIYTKKTCNHFPIQNQIKPWETIGRWVGTEGIFKNISSYIFKYQFVVKERKQVYLIILGILWPCGIGRLLDKKISSIFYSWNIIIL